MQMAVFLVNTCKFRGCGLTFRTLGDLIQHIEDIHIDTDPRIVEKQEQQQPSSLALSYVLRFFTDAGRKEHLQEIQRKKQRALSPASSIRSATPTGSEFDEDDHAVPSDDEDSDDSWTTQEQFASELILSSMTSNKDNTDPEKPFACPIPGCKKRYKNVNGIKYHARHGHKKETRVRKQFKCRCGKSYKTSQGLRNHALTIHPPTELGTVTQTRPLLIPTRLVPELKTQIQEVTKVSGFTPVVTSTASLVTPISSAQSPTPVSALSAMGLGQTLISLGSVGSLQTSLLPQFVAQRAVDTSGGRKLVAMEQQVVPIKEGKTI